MSLLLSVLLAVLGLIAVAGPSHAADAAPITPGEAFTVQASGFNSTNIFTFSGEAGQRVTLDTTKTGSSGYQYSVTGPDGSLKARLIDGYGELGVLPSSGPWTLTARNVGTTSATIKVTLNLVTDVSGPLTLNTATTATFDRPGRNYTYTFDAVAGEKLAVDVSDLQLSDTYQAGVAVTVLRPGEADSGDVTPDYGLSSPALQDWTFDTTGTWTLKFDPVHDTTGSIVFTATKPVDQVIAVSPDTATKVTYAGGGQNVRFTVRARKGQRLLVKVSDSNLVSPTGSVPDPAISTSLLRPDGTSWDGGAGSLYTAPMIEENGPLDTTGTWTLILDPPGDTQGSQTISVSLISDIVGSTRVGRPLLLRMTTVGQNASYTFPGKAGQTLVADLSAVHLTNDGYTTAPRDPAVIVSLVDPDGNTLTQLLTSEQQTHGEQELPTTGKYTLVVDPDGYTVGSAVLTLHYAKTMT